MNINSLKRYVEGYNKEGGNTDFKLCSIVKIIVDEGRPCFYCGTCKYYRLIVSNFKLTSRCK